MSVEEARKILGAKYSHLSNEQLVQLITKLGLLAKYSLTLIQQETEHN